MKDNPFQSPQTRPVKGVGRRRTIMLFSRVVSVILLVILVAVAVAGYVVVRLIGP